MNRLEALKRYFHAGTGEAELQLLEEAFVYEPAFVKAAAPPAGSPRLLIGRKGAGKTALVEYLRLKLELDGVPVVLLRPDDFDTSAMGTGSDLGTIKRVSFAFLAIAVADRLSQKGVLATGANKVLSAAARGYNRGNMDSVQRLLALLLPVGKALSGINFEAMLPNNVPHPREVATAIRAELGSSTSVAYVIIDDTDQFGGPDLPGFFGPIETRKWPLRSGCLLPCASA